MKTLYCLLFIITLLNSVGGQTETKQQLSIGDHYGGGVIFSINATGQHGLVAAPFDQKELTRWGNTGRTNATYMNEGMLNTETIVQFMKKKKWFKGETPAACMCDSSTLNGYSDWYLPAIDELKEMYNKQKEIGNFNAGDYCSSTESDADRSWNIHFRPHRKIIFEDNKAFGRYYVRCIRKF